MRSAQSRKSNKERRRRAKERSANFLREYKEYHKCQKCGEGRAVCLDMHHRDPTTKAFDISECAADKALGTLGVELAKCDVLCANCHRIVHAETRQVGQLLNHEEKGLFE